MINDLNVNDNKNTDNLNNDVITLKEFKTKELMHYRKLDIFFSNCTNDENNIMVDIINGKNLISLRFLDWFVTRYSYLYKLSINVNNTYIKQDDFNINISYKAQLKSFKKKYFDPFRRKKKFYYINEKNNLVLLTTLGQLNFFRWAISYDIIKYADNNYKFIIGKLSHVNKYFKKNIIENNSFSTSDENTDNNKSILDSEIKDSESKLSETLSIDSINLDKISISNNMNKKLKDKNAKYKNPVVLRNIFIEL
jgi:hypothetical protein